MYVYTYIYIYICVYIYIYTSLRAPAEFAPLQTPKSRPGRPDLGPGDGPSGRGRGA